jgi:hypothetical protein
LGAGGGGAAGFLTDFTVALIRSSKRLRALRISF